MSIYSLQYKSLAGHEVLMEEYRGKAILIVNTASKCGFTGQYKGLQELYEKYKDKGFVVIGFPCDQFKEQEFATSDEISEFCKVRYGVSFPLSEKIYARGDDAHPIFKYLISQKGFEGLGKGIKSKAFEMLLKTKYKESYSDNEVKWNFTKFLIDKQGNVVQRYESVIEVKDIENDLKGLL
jgi:glutathione peroxidase